MCVPLHHSVKSGKIGSKNHGIREREMLDICGAAELVFLRQFGYFVSLRCWPGPRADAQAADDLLANTVAYADDSDFICDDDAVMTRIKEAAPAVFARWDLKMNEDKTEETKVFRSTQADAPTHAASLAWHTTKKLGSLLDDAADLRARKRLTTTAFNNMWKIWMRRGLISEGTRVRLYKCYVLPVLLYNCGTWALTPTSLAGLDSFHRRQLRRLLGIFHPNTLADVALHTL
ncbi:hypothetical protein SDRG_15173 [Saprolegnia diclina VS20]|uniref:Reverse transcriptase domain-containing protein n=1 Tax=Saprolegnia diclina (strain VS20) TaxID=1156394 RepID=T0RBQ9_SAPDV|nr:hypothetical protein SDRG_15173 [Saprolegnia diclina VS20]EQC26957.1 hypothetical protein SDRG_15173 [Saprolegnia diclina VS20]|eukprot:XP_008619559.1 hypothetical protein SDRG_15173 [Saprolegnia diclina VS20]